MNDPIPEEEKSRRLAVLQDKQRQIQTKHNEALVGKTFEVMVTGKSRRQNQWSGHTSCHRVLNFTSQAEGLLGTYVQVHVAGAGPNSMVGEHCT
jgi:tRNA-2-methylthio-N6-dimethylallyladenosine synthase